jgi:hypothetical protein
VICRIPSYLLTLLQPCTEECLCVVPGSDRSSPPFVRFLIYTQIVHLLPKGHYLFISMTTSKLGRFIGKIRILIVLLERYDYLVVHQRISISYYLQKEEEFRLLKEQLDHPSECHQEITSRILTLYQVVYSNWRRDMLWMNKYRLMNAVLIVPRLHSVRPVL